MKLRNIFITVILLGGGILLYNEWKRRGKSIPFLSQEEADALARKIFDLGKGVAGASKDAIMEIAELTKKLAKSGYKYVVDENGEGKAVKIEDIPQEPDAEKKEDEIGELSQAEADGIAQRIYDLFVKYRGKKHQYGWSWKDKEKKEEHDALLTQLGEAGYSYQTTKSGGKAFKKGDAPKRPMMSQNEADALAITIYRKQKEMKSMRMTKPVYQKYMTGINSLITKLKEAGFRYTNGKAQFNNA